MTISFNSIPTTTRIPFTFVEVDNSKANQGPALLAYRGLIIGQKISAGTATADTLYLVSSADQVAGLAGRGSMLHRQAKAWFAANKATELWIGVLADNGAGVAATNTLTVTGPATAAGTISLYVGGTLIECAVASGDVQNTIATNLGAAINAVADLPVTAGVGTNVVTLTNRHKGLLGNELDVRLNYQDGDALPAGVAIAVTAPSGGTTAPSLANLIAAMGDSWFQIWACPYTDATSLTAVEAELNSRFGPTRMIDGVAFAAKNDTLANCATLGNSRNNAHVSIVATNKSPTPVVEYGAQLAAVAALAGSIDPARPFQTLSLPTCLAPAELDLFTNDERDVLLHDGISVTRTDSGGNVVIDRLITTYKTNAAGSADESYLDVTTLLTLLYLRYSFRTEWQNEHPRSKLANDGTRFGAGQPVVTPKIGKMFAVLWFDQMEELGLVENLDEFKANLVVERDTSNPNRLNFLLPPDLINQLIGTAAQIQFLL